MLLVDYFYNLVNTYMAKQDKHIYLNNPNLPAADAEFAYTPEMVSELAKCKKNILHFAENYFFIRSADEGKIKIQLHKYQKRILRKLRDNRFFVLLSGRQAGKSTMMTIYALWIACFEDYQNVLVVANKEDTAKEILKRTKLAYEELPMWLKPGVRKWAETSVVFSNGSELIISTTTGTAARGLTVSCVDGGSTITIRDKITGEIINTTMEGLEELLKDQPLIENTTLVE